MQPQSKEIYETVSKIDKLIEIKALPPDASEVLNNVEEDWTGTLSHLEDSRFLLWIDWNESWDNNEVH